MSKTLLKTLQEAAAKPIWSKGVEISRLGNIQGAGPNIANQKAEPNAQQEADEYRLRVSVKGQPISRLVTLWPEDDDWNCDCASAADPCEHVVAAAIALRKAQESGQGLPSCERATATLSYHFSAKDGLLHFRRYLLHEGKEEPCPVSLAALQSGRIPGPPISPSRQDMTADHLLDGYRQGGALPAKVLQALIAALQNCDQVFLDKKPISCSPLTTGYIAYFEDKNAGVQLSSRKDPSIIQIFKNGAALCGDNLSDDNVSSHKLQPLNPNPALSPELLKMLAQGHYFGQKELVEVASELLPLLKTKMRVEAPSHNLPTTCHTVPRIVWDCTGAGELLSVTPLLAYGDPALAKIVHGKMQSLDAKVPLRLLDAERELRDKFSRRFPAFTLGSSVPFRGEKAVFFLENLEQQKETFGGEGLDNFVCYSPLKAVANPLASLSSDPLTFVCDKKGQSTALADPARVLSAWAGGESLVPLDSGGWAAIPTDWLQRYGAKLRDLLSAKENAKENGDTLPACMAPTLAEFMHDLSAPVSLDLKRWQELADDFTVLPTSPLPVGLRAELRSYQKEGYHWLSFLRQAGMGALLADDMGLGKTLQALAIIPEQTQHKTLIIAPTSVLYNWAQELEKFRPNTRFNVYHGPQRQLLPEAQVTLSTYAILRLDLEKLQNEAFDTLILDEAHYIKNPKSQAAQAAFSLKAKFRLALSGTPVENRLEDLWSLFYFLNRGLLGTAEHFQRHYQQAILAGDSEAAERLRRRVKPFVLRRLKSEVAKDLPARTEIVRHCELNEEERQSYEALRLASKKEILAKLSQGGQVFQALELLLRLRQAACHLSLVPGLAKGKPSSKLELLVELLQQCQDNGNKALVFSQWTSFLDLMEPALKNAGIAFLRIDGQTKNRQDLVNQFQNDPSYQVMILSLKAAGVGLNLTAADHVFLTDPWWNPAVEDQAADRAHRIGQTKPVFVTRLIAENTVEEKILALQARKKNLADAVLAPQNAQAGVLTKDDLLELLT